MAEKTTIKLQDTSSYVGSGSRLEAYWSQAGFKKFHARFRKGAGAKEGMSFRTVENLEQIVKTFRLHSVGFGNWLSQEDRYNYVSAFVLAAYDLNKVLRFNNNIGLNGSVSITFGARGKSSASAHFEPHTFIINMTRYADCTEAEKQAYFVHTGGAGALAHEYGHALDYYFSLFREQSYKLPALTGGRSVAGKMMYVQGPLGVAMSELLDAIIWTKPYTKHSAYYERLLANFSADYWFRRNEIFARCWEAYVQYKLSTMGIYNAFLTQTKYSAKAYPTRGEIMKVAPLFEKLLQLMRQKL